MVGGRLVGAACVARRFVGRASVLKKIDSASLLGWRVRTEWAWARERQAE